MVVTAFVEADDYYNSHVPDLMTRMGAVQELFAVDGLQVEDPVPPRDGQQGQLPIRLRGDQRHIPVSGRPPGRGRVAPDGRNTDKVGPPAGRIKGPHRP